MAVHPVSHHRTTPTPRRVQGKAAYRVAAIQGHGMTGVASDRSAAEQIEMQDTLDVSSDACFRSVLRDLVMIRRCLWLARTSSDRNGFLRDAEARADRAIGMVTEGIRLDGLEDEHRQAGLADVERSAQADRAVVAGCEILLTGKAPETCGATRAPIADEDGCRIEFAPCAESGRHERHVFLTRQGEAP